ncbi:MAG: hypothetical protein V4510_06535 [bacterium]
MYPFSGRMRWLLAGRHAHVVRAFELHPTADSLVMERVGMLRRWTRVHAVVGTFLLFGLLGAAATTLANLFPTLGGVWSVIRDASALIGGLAGLLTIVYLTVTRLLGQIEADILMLMLQRKKTH